MPDFLKKIKNFFLNLDDKGIFIIWAVGISLAGALLWGLTGSLRETVTIDALNRRLEQMGEERRADSLISGFGNPGTAMQAGMWTTLTNKEKAVIFPLITDGVFSPCLGIVNNEGNLANIIPLSDNAQTILNRSSPGRLKIWVRRIEAAAGQLKEKK
jgi:hypothetical protein